MTFWGVFWASFLVLFLYKRPGLTEFGAKLGEFCEKLGEFAFAHNNRLRGTH